MVKYPHRQIKFTAENIKDLLSEKGTRIDPHQIDVKDGHHMFVNAAQNHWLNKSMERGLPIHFPPMNEKQMVHNLKGGSVFSDLRDSLDGAARKKIESDIESHGNKGIDYVLDKLKQIGSDKGLPKITTALVDKLAKPAAQAALKKIISAAGKKIFGHGMGKNGCGVRGCKNGNKCGTMSTSQKLYPANQKPI